MNAKLRALLGVSPLLVMASSLPAEPGPVAAPVDEAVLRSDAPVAIESTRATALMGREVRDARDRSFAKVEDFVIDIDNGRIVQVILSGDTVMDGRVEVPPRTFGYTPGRQVLRWKGDEEKLRGAPRFSPPGSNQPGQSVHAAEVYRYHGEEPYFIVTGQTPRPQSHVHAHGRTVPVPPPVSLGRLSLAGDLIGLTVRDAMDDKVGSVDDLIMDIPSGRVVAIVVRTGGFLGMGERQQAIPPSTARHVVDDKEELRLNISREALRAAPTYSAEEERLFDDAAYIDSVYAAYQIPPYSTFAGAVDSIHLSRERDRLENASADEGGAPTDRELAARIRKAVVARDDFSINAQNVKVSARDGRVTLRGPVETAEEKRDIEAIAAREAGSASRVTSEIEVASAR